MSPMYEYSVWNEVLSESANHMTVKYTLIKTKETITVTHDVPIPVEERMRFGDKLTFPSMYYPPYPDEE